MRFTLPLFAILLLFPFEKSAVAASPTVDQYACFFAGQSLLENSGFDSTRTAVLLDSLCTITGVTPVAAIAFVKSHANRPVEWEAFQQKVLTVLKQENVTLPPPIQKSKSMGEKIVHKLKRIKQILSKKLNLKSLKKTFQKPKSEKTK